MAANKVSMNNLFKYNSGMENRLRRFVTTKYKIVRHLSIRQSEENTYLMIFTNLIFSDIHFDY